VHRRDPSAVARGGAAAAAARPWLLRGVVGRSDAAATRRFLVAEDVVDVVVPPAPARRSDGLTRSDGGVVERPLAAGIALVVLALLDVVALDEAEVLECASPCIPDRHLASDSA
jgi:hypothetical protein